MEIRVIKKTLPAAELEMLEASHERLIDSTLSTIFTNIYKHTSPAILVFDWDGGGWLCAEW